MEISTIMITTITVVIIGGIYKTVLFPKKEKDRYERNRERRKK